MVHFVISGFGDFAGVHGNPTEYIAKNIEDFLHSRKKSLPNESKIFSCKPLKASGEAVRQWLMQAAERVSEELPDTAEVAWVHFGVDVNATHFKVEARAKNEATFRVADQGGWQPDHVSIDAQQPLQSYLNTDLPVSTIAAAAGHEQGQQVAISQDAGLFVCNYTYYKSLQQSQRVSSKQKWHSVFIHVPPFEMIAPEEQLTMAGAILDSIAAALSPVRGVPVVLGQAAGSPVSVGQGRSTRKLLECLSCCKS